MCARFNCSVQKRTEDRVVAVVVVAAGDEAGGVDDAVRISVACLALASS
jgi:hypothetical protein